MGGNNIPWTKKYQPNSTAEIQGQDSAVKALVEYVKTYKKQKKKALIIYGPPGNGKTASVHAVANEFRYEILEINASDFRNKDSINQIVGGASQQMSLFGKSKIILVDELDGLSGREDRGGISAITKLLQTSAFPIIMTANDPYHKKFSTLRKKSEMIEFKTLSYLSVYSYLKKICKNENIDFQEEALKSLARRAGGDLRGAITDLQLISAVENKISSETLETLSGRRQKESMISALMKIFKTTDPLIALQALDNVDENLDKVMLWIDENLPKEYTKPEDLASAYDKLSRADVFKGRIRRWQHWRFLVYINALLTAGVALSKDEKYKRFINYTPTKRILKLWIAKMRFAKRKAIAEKIALNTHTSTRVAIKDTFPYIKAMFKKDKNFAKQLAEKLELTKDEVEWLGK